MRTEMVTEVTKCTKSSGPRTFDSPETMEAAGWRFDFPVTPLHKFKGWSPTCDGKQEGFWGVDTAAIGSVSITLRGAGIATLEWGNCWTGGMVRKPMPMMTFDRSGYS